jgi:hypothetical protein
MPGFTIGKNMIQFGTSWRLGALDGNHLCLGHKSGQTVQIFRSDGTLHPGPRTDWNPWSLPLGSPEGVEIGTNMIQIGPTWRIGALDGNHLCIGHSGGKTVQIFRSDGTLHPGPRTDWNPWSLELGAPSGVTNSPVGRWLQIGDTWRIGVNDEGVGSNHLCIGHKTGKTAQIYRSDGTLHPGPRTDWNPWAMGIMIRSPHFGDAPHARVLDYWWDRNIFHFYPAHAGNNQMFYFEHWPPPARIKSYWAWDRCLDFDYGNNIPVFWHCHDGNNQKWYFRDGASNDVPYDIGSARRLVTLRDSNMCLDINYNDHQIEHMHPCHGGDNQKFYVSEPGCKKPDWWCTHGGSTNEFAVCGHVPGNVCTDTNGHWGFWPCSGDPPAGTAWPNGMCHPPPGACDTHGNWCTHGGSTSIKKKCGGLMGNWCEDTNGHGGFAPCGYPHVYPSWGHWPHGSCPASKSVQLASSEEPCRAMRDAHGVVVGKTWGSLPKDQQKRWRELNCNAQLAPVDTNNVSVAFLTSLIAN